MKLITRLIGPALLLVGLGLPVAGGQTAPASAEQLRSQLETVLKTGDTNALKSLIYDWQHVTEATNSMVYEDITQNLLGPNLGGTIQSVQLGSLEKSEDYSKAERMETEDGILIFTPNLTALGIIAVKVKPADTNDTPWAKELVYGATNNAFYLRDTLMQKLPKPTVKEPAADHH